MAASVSLVPFPCPYRFLFFHSYGEKEGKKAGRKEGRKEGRKTESSKEGRREGKKDFQEERKKRSKEVKEGNLKHFERFSISVSGIGGCTLC